MHEIDYFVITLAVLFSIYLSIEVAYYVRGPQFVPDEK